MKKLLVGALLILAMTGCSDKDNFLKEYDMNVIQKNALIETNLSLYDDNLDKVYRILTDGSEYYIITTYDGLDTVRKFKSLNESIITENFCSILKDDIVAMPRVLQQLPQAQTIGNSTVINNNVYVGDKEPQLSQKELRLIELKRELAELER